MAKKIFQITATTALVWTHGLYAQDAAQAQRAEPAAVGLEEVVVTAQKRSESAQDVPISISAFNAATLRDASINQLSDLIRLVPTYRVGVGAGTSSARNNIRGLGSFGNSVIEPSVATYIDGVYVPRAGSLIAGLLDLQSVEVLSGPQGTLFGRNASVGAINITTAPPTDELEGSVAAEYATGERYRGEAIINVPVSDRVAFRFAGLGEKFGGYWHHEPDGKRFGGLDTVSGRLSGRINLTDSLTWIVRGDYQKQTGDGWQNFSLKPSSVTPAMLTRYGQVLGGRLPTVGIDSNGTLMDISTADVDAYHWGTSSDLTLETQSGFVFKLIDSYRHWRADERDGEVSLTPVPLVYRESLYNSRSQNHEIQVISPQDTLLGGKLNFVGGLYYFKEDLDVDYDYNLRSEWCSTAIATFAPPLVPACNAGVKDDAFYNRFPQLTKSYAAYAQATYEILPKVDLTLGGRWTKETKDARYVGARINPSALFGTNENTSLEYSDKRFTKRVNLSWKPLDELMLFTTFSTGFKAGGFNAGASNAVLGQQRAFDPETVKNYEIGAKGQFFDRTLTTNLTVFRMDVQGFQERALAGLITLVRNVGDIRSQGVELTADALPTSWLRLNAGVAYLDAEFTGYPNAPAVPWLTGVQNLTGARPTFAPEWTTTFGAELRSDLPGGYRTTLRADVNTVSSANLNAVNDDSPRTVQSGYALLSARFTIFSPQDRFNIAVFGQNLTDKHYCATENYQILGVQLGAIDVPGQTAAVTCIHGAPRTVGLRVGTTF